MANKHSLFEPRREVYRRLTHSPLHCMVFIMPLLGLFHVGSAFSNTTLFASCDLELILGLFGPTAWYAPPILVLTVLVMLHLVRRDRWRIYPIVLAGMAACFAEDKVIS